MSAMLESRRTHGAYRTESEARQGARDLNHLTNGTPWGWTMLLGRKMGAYVIYSVPTDLLKDPTR